MGTEYMLGEVREDESEHAAKVLAKDINTTLGTEISDKQLQQYVKSRWWLVSVLAHKIVQE